jgi:cytochrome c553
LGGVIALGLSGFALTAMILVLASCGSRTPAAAIDLDDWGHALPTASVSRAAALYAAKRTLAGEPEPVSCAVCHGAQGQGNYGLENPKHIAPHLAGLNPTYVGEQLRAYAIGTRKFALMHAMAAPLSAQDVADLAVYVHGLKGDGLGHAPVTDPAIAARGYAIWHAGKEGRLAACATCHGADGAGKVLRSPEIAGEPLPYLVAQLRYMRAQGRSGSVAADTMTAEAQRMSDQDITDVAAYISGIEPASERGTR